MKKYTHYVHQKLIPDSFLILVKQPLHSRNYFENILKEDYKKAIKKFKFIKVSFLMDKIMENKTDLELVNSRSSGYKTSS